MFTFDPDARRARIGRPGEAPIDGQLVCYYPCPRCSNPARARAAGGSVHSDR